MHKGSLVRGALRDLHRTTLARREARARARAKRQLAAMKRAYAKRDAVQNEGQKVDVALTATINTTQTVTAARATTATTARSVEFFIDGASLGTSTTYPYKVNWTPKAKGTFTLTAEVTNGAGAKTRGPAVQVKVVAAPSKRRYSGRREHDIENGKQMLLAAAAVITLLRRFGPRGFSEAEITVFPSERPGESSFFTADADILEALTSCDLPAPLLLVQAFRIAHPTKPNVRNRQTGEASVKWIMRRERWPCSDEIPKSRFHRLVRDLLILRIQAEAADQMLAARPGFRRREPRSQLLAGRFGMSKRMLCYWRKRHPKAGEAARVIGSLIDRPRHLPTDGSGVGMAVMPALTAVSNSYLRPADKGDEETEREKLRAVKEANRLWDRYKNRLMPAATKPNENTVPGDRIDLAVPSSKSGPQRLDGDNSPYNQLDEIVF